MSTLGFAQSSGGIYLELHGPIDLRPRRVEVPIRDGKVNPDGAIIMLADTIGATQEEAEIVYRKFGFDPVFVEIGPPDG